MKWRGIREQNNKNSLKSQEQFCGLCDQKKRKHHEKKRNKGKKR